MLPFKLKEMFFSAGAIPFLCIYHVTFPNGKRSLWPFKSNLAVLSSNGDNRAMYFFFSLYEPNVYRIEKKMH